MLWCIKKRLLSHPPLVHACVSDVTVFKIIHNEMSNSTTALVLLLLSFPTSELATCGFTSISPVTESQGRPNKLGKMAI